ncbi:MAG: bis(5'-nucleosyl)-tetraphosphatase [Candidatus Bipolaricaulia bacterium]
MTTKSTSPSGEERSAGFVVYYSERPGERRYLLLRHRDGGHWAFPKGRIEQGEEPEDAARRETQEETGIEDVRIVPGFRAVSQYRFLRRGRAIEKSVVYFLAEASPADVRLSSEHSDSTWLDSREARRKLTFEETRRVLDRAEGRLAERPLPSNRGTG